MNQTATLTYAAANAMVEGAQKRKEAAAARLQVLATKKQSATDRLTELKKEAEEKYGTSDPEILTEQLNTITAKNSADAIAFDAAVTAFEQSLSKIEQNIKALEGVQ